MSKTMMKQHSLESPGVGYQRQSSHNGESHSSRLNRSMTLTELERRTTPTGTRRLRDPSSPLKRFARAKESISKAFGLIRDRLVESQAFLRLAYKGEESQPIAALLEKSRGIEDILSRDHMKVAFFGRTSNGKSTVINALLHSKVLPAGIGHTTNCFCSVRGSDSEEGYVLTPGSQERQNVKNVQQLAHSLRKEHLAPSSLVQVFWPKTKCPLLRDDVEFVDSPGVDMSPNMDEWINKHCLDADVFVLVSNAESTLMTAEKSFFYRVSEHLSKPNIFILNNRWDASEQEQDITEVRAQHLDTDIGFLVRELKVIDEPTARNRVFFISAKEVLHYRIRTQQDAINPAEGLADGHKSRQMEFEQFERRFKECISSSAIRTKFEHHHKQGTAIVGDLGQLLQQEERKIIDNSKSVHQQLQLSWQRHQRLLGEGSRVGGFCRERVDSTVQAVEKKVSLAMKDIISQMGAIVDRYDHGFDPAHPESYKAELYEHMDRSLGQELGRVGSTVLGRMHDETQRALIDAYQKFLQLPGDELTRFTQLVTQPELSYVLRCADLCEDFQVDLEFHFSLGITSMLGMLNAGSVVGGLRSRLSQLWSVLPLDSSLALPILLLLAGAMLPRFLNWRVVLPTLAAYGALYTFEWARWTPRSQEAALKQQFVQHMREKVRYQIHATSASYSSQLSRGLGLLTRQLQSSLEVEQERETARIAELTEEQVKLTQLQEKAKKLRNAVRLVCRDLEDFRDLYLDEESPIS